MPIVHGRMGVLAGNRRRGAWMMYEKGVRRLRQMLPVLPLALSQAFAGQAVGAAPPAPADDADPAASVSPAALAHIQRIEASILGPVLVKGVPTTPRTLAQRMQDL